MRTTMDIDEDILQAAREIAKQQGISMGKALSNLARRTLTRQTSTEKRNGVPLFPSQVDGEAVTLELVNRLRDEQP